jgi:hypothetical protein
LHRIELLRRFARIARNGHKMVRVGSSVVHQSALKKQVDGRQLETKIMRSELLMRIIIANGIAFACALIVLAL